MVDDRHSAYRSMFTMDSISSLFKEFEGKESTAHIAYVLLSIQKKHPEDTIQTVIIKAKQHLYGLQRSGG